MIDYDNDGQVARITLNRPDAGNRITYAMMNALIAALDDASKSNAVILMLRSTGNDFTLGRDQKEKVDVSRRDNLGLILQANDLLRHFPGVSIAGIRGRAMGFGSGLSLHSTISIAEDSAVLGFDEIKHGLAPLIVVAYLPYFIKPKIARELCLSGRDVSAREALDVGLVSRVVPEGALDAEIDGLVTQLTAFEPGALRLIRRYQEDVAPYPTPDQGRDGVERLAAWLEAGKPVLPH